jgi:hypothetical protein
MRQRLAPLLLYETDGDAAEAQRSPKAKKQATGVSPDAFPVHGFRTPLADLATLAHDTIIAAVAPPGLPQTAVTFPTAAGRAPLNASAW